MKYEYYNDYLTKDTESDKVDWRAANGFCFDENMNVALVWEEEKGFWNLPGGGREGNESPKETFEREVLEDTAAYLCHPQCNPIHKRIWT